MINHSYQSPNLPGKISAAVANKLQYFFFAKKKKNSAKEEQICENDQISGI